MPSVDSDSHSPLERLRSTVHSAITRESPVHGKPSYLPLERLWSAGAGKERVLAIGAMPIFLYHGSDSRATVGHTEHHVSQWSVSPTLLYGLAKSRHTRQIFFLVIRASLSPECWESTWARGPSQCAFRVFFTRQWEVGVSPGISTCQHKVVVGGRGGIAPETPLWVGGLSASLPERTVSTVRKFSASKKTVTSECTHATKTQHTQCQALHSFIHFIHSRCVTMCVQCNGTKHEHTEDTPHAHRSTSNLRFLVSPSASL